MVPTVLIRPGDDLDDAWSKTVRTRTVTIVQARGYLAKADEFSAAASAELKAGRAVEATSLAVHSGNNSADAVCGFDSASAQSVNTMARYSFFPNTIGGDSMDLGKHLLRPLVMKTKMEYGSDECHS